MSVNVAASSGRVIKQLVAKLRTAGAAVGKTAVHEARGQGFGYRVGQRV